MACENPYERIFEVESENFRLRELTDKDAGPLLACYGDARASLVFPDDNCDQGFFCRSREQMSAMIDFWIRSWKAGYFVRYAVVDKRAGACVGTIELFNRGRHGAYENVGVLRVDIASAYETRADIRELTLLMNDRLSGAFGLDHFLTFAPPVAQARRAALESIGFRALSPGELVPWPGWFFASRADVKTAREARYFRAFLKKTGRNENTRFLECDHFEVTEKGANELLQLVLCGKKRATSSSARAYEADGVPLPKPGDLSVITDFYGAPKCVIETTRATVLPFCEMTFEICAREGEDECLETWRQNHIAFFTADARETGYAFTEDMPVVFEDFKLAYTGSERDDEPEAYPLLDASYETLSRAQNTVRAFANEAAGILGAPLQSAYLCGSAPFGDFCPGYSDLDFFFVSARPLNEADFARFHALYKRYRDMGDGWFSALEGEIVCADALSNPRAGQCVYWGTRGDRLKDEYSLSGFSLRGLIRRGMLIAGEDIRARMPRAEDAQMRAQARSLTETVRAHAKFQGKNVHEADFLLLIAQTLYYLKTGDIACKSRAAGWLRDAYPQDAALARGIRAALCARNAPGSYTKEMADDLEVATGRALRMLEDALGA